MKTKTPLWLLALTFALVMPLGAAEEQTSDTNSPPQTATAAETAKPDSASQAQTPAADAGGTNQAPAGTEAASTDSAPLPEGTLRMNFRGAPLNLILDYLSDAAGFIINKETEVRGTVDVWSKDPVSKEEAVQLLNSVLKKNGYAVTRNGRILTILSMDTAKTADLEVVTGSDPQEVERSDEVVTQIIPVRFANATQLMNNLQVLLPTSATLSVNESANSLILVASKTDIRRMLRIVTALDTSISSVTSIKVFPLRYADAKALATVVQQLFATQATGQQLFNMFQRGGPGGGPGGMAGQAGASGAGGGSKVVASADEYSNSLIVSAAPETMATIASMVDQVDQPVDDLTVLRVFTLHNADPTELAAQLDELFPDETRSTTGNQRGGFRFFGGGPFGANNQSTGTSQRSLKKSKVVSVADARTSSLIVAASSELMPQIAEMIAKLDSSPAKKESVAIYDLQNANPQDVYQVLQDLFNRNNSMRNNNNNNRSSLLGQNNPLTQRSTQSQSGTTSGTSRFGSGTSSRTGASSMGF
jgi:general secretion pathway protein D